MNRRLLTFVVILFLSVSISGCMVGRGTYQKKVLELSSCTKDLADSAAENNTLKNKIDTLSADREQLKEAFATAAREKSDLETVMTSKSDTLKKNILELRKKNLDLEGENQILAENLSLIEKHKEEQLQEIKNTQQQLEQTMKDDIAKGKIIIKESRGKLFVDIPDSILFDASETEIKADGQSVLHRVLNVLSNLKNRSIRIEGYTDNVKLKGPLSKKYPTSWDLAAAKAISVTRFFQKQGVDPTNLSAASYGEYKPVTGNNSLEGKARNRRLIITVTTQ